MSETLELTTAPRKGNWMQTYSGGKFWAVDPRPEEVVIEDIAHALSNMCRYAGHCNKFYSVAEHSVLVSEWLLNNGHSHHALWGLLHDASEAYLVDIPRPIKPSLTNYYDLEAELMKVICEKYGLEAEMPDIVKYADNHILADERNQNMKMTTISNIEWGAGGDPLGITLRYYTPEEAEEAFLDVFDALT